MNCLCNLFGGDNLWLLIAIVLILIAVCGCGNTCGSYGYSNCGNACGGNCGCNSCGSIC